MATTYEPIQTYTLGSAQSSVTFSSIPQTYTDLVVVIAGTLGANLGVDTQFNSDTGTSYSRTRFYGNGTIADTIRSTNANAISAGYIGTSESTTIIHIMNYANTTTYKTLVARGSAASAQAVATVGLWRSTSAINSITLSGGTFQSGSSFTLYGIKAA